MGGPQFAREVLEHLLGAERAEEILGALTAQAELRPFDFLRRTPPEQIATFLADEAPQTIALVVASAAHVAGRHRCSAACPELQADVAMRIATMKETNPGVIEDIERGLRLKLSNVARRRSSPQAGGVDSLAEILNRAGPLDRAHRARRDRRAATPSWPTRSASSCSPSTTSSSSATATSSSCCARSTRRTSRWRCAASTSEVRDTIFRNMSQRGAEMLREELEYRQPQRRSVVEEAQGRSSPPSAASRTPARSSSARGAARASPRTTSSDGRHARSSSRPPEAPAGCVVEPARRGSRRRRGKADASARQARPRHEEGFAGPRRPRRRWPRRSPRCEAAAELPAERDALAAAEAAAVELA